MTAPQISTTHPSTRPASPARSAMEVITVPTMSPAALSRCMDEHTPVILTDALRDWGTKGWTFDHLAETYGDQSLIVRGGDRETWRTLARVDLADYLKFIAGESLPALDRFRLNNPYAAFNPVAGTERDLDFASLVPEGFHVGSDILWIGPKGTLTPLHTDESGSTLLAQVQGSKEVTLFPADQGPLLYPSDVFDYTSVFSSVNIDAPDLDRHPRFADAVPTTLVVHPGELLMIPLGMWHQVVALDDSISATVRTCVKEHRSSKMMWKWKARGLAHLAGLYKPRRCLCHIVDVKELELDRFSQDLSTRIALAADRLEAHGLDLADLMEW